MSQDLPKVLKYCIISIVKEALSNVTRHSDADRVKLLLREHPAFYQILIQDNGKCVHPGEGTGIGITNMRQRVETFGGTIDILTENGYLIYPHSKSRYSCRKMRNCPGFFHCRFAAKLPGK